MSRILCLRFPLWPLQQRIATQPELRGRAIALFARDGSRGERLTLCSPAAHARGLRVDMTVAEAGAIDSRSTVPRRPATRVVRATKDQPPRSDRPTMLLAHDAAADRLALETLAMWCERYSPLVGLEDAAEPTCLLLDIGGVAKLFGGEEMLCAKMSRELRERGYDVKLGVADTIGAAWAVGNCGFQISDFRWEKDVVHQQSEIRNQKSEIAPATILPPSETLARLAPLPPSALRLPEATLALLEELGIVQIGQLLALPRDALLSRLGELVVRRLAQAEGTAREVIVSHRPVDEFSASWSLEHPSDKREVIAAVLTFLLDRLSRQLDEQDLGAVQLVCRLQVVDRPAVELSLGLFRPTACPQHLMELLELQLDRRARPGLVSDMHVAATVTAALEVQQGELFADRQRDAPRQLGLLVDRLASRLGRDAVVGVQPQTDALPERAVRYVPLTELRRDSFSPRRRTTQRKSSKANKMPDAVIVSPRPLVILQPPVAIDNFTAVASDGPLTRFEFRRQEYEIAEAWGPERIETSWWRGRTLRRDYWRVETTTGQRFWLFRDLRGGRWFLHGQFD